MISSLVTSSKLMPSLTTKEEMKDFFLSCKHVETVDRKVEGVLIRNGFIAPLMGLRATLEQSEVLGYPSIVKQLLECAIEHKKKIRKERQRIAATKEHA